jgi:F-type H+-transporting ATPase subunit epsilon
MQALFDLEIHTPYRLFFTGRVQAIILTLEDGEICVYANHSYIAAPVVECMLRIKHAEGNWSCAFISRGIFEVKKNKNVIVVDAAEWPQEIDREHALASKYQAEKILSDANFRFEIDKAKEQLRRAECRLEVIDHNNMTK